MYQNCCKKCGSIDLFMEETRTPVTLVMGWIVILRIHLWGKYMEVTHGRGYVYSIQYHIVWCVKYRHKILTLKIENRLVELLYQIARENNFQIIERNTDKDHVHILINCTPQHYIPEIVQKNERNNFSCFDERKRRSIK